MLAVFSPPGSHFFPCSDEGEHVFLLSLERFVAPGIQLTWLFCALNSIKDLRKILLCGFFSLFSFIEWNQSYLTAFYILSIQECNSLLVQLHLNKVRKKCYIHSLLFHSTPSKTSNHRCWPPNSKFHDPLISLDLLKPIKNGCNELLKPRNQNFPPSQAFISVLTVHCSSQYQQLFCSSENKVVTQLYQRNETHEKVNFSSIEVRIV